MDPTASQRMALVEKVQAFCDQARTHDEILGLLIVDLQDFRRINGVYGYRIGDLVLEETAQRLQQAGLKNSVSQRIGNDEFIVILPGVQDPRLLGLAANKIARILGEPLRFDDDCILRLTTVIGHASTACGCWQAEDLLCHAERNLIDARSQNLHFLPEAPSSAGSAQSWAFESQLHQAVEQNELILFYQPKVDLFSDQVTHAEALVRWPHPDLGMVPPRDFIPLLEKTGGIRDMTKWALHTALRESREWPLTSTGTPHAIAVNVSSSVLEDPEFPSIVKSALSIWEADPQNLTLEITEDALIQEERCSYRSIHRLKDLGLKISIDDFGTGYSCLSYFNRLPADELKIDRSFISHLQRNRDHEYLTRLIIDLAHRFDMQVVAEGVEDLATYRRLQAFGCDFAQGYYISRPRARADYDHWLRQSSWGLPPATALPAAQQQKG